MARLFLQVILLVAFVAVLDCAPASPPLSDPVPPRAHDTPQPKAHDAITPAPKPRTARAAQQNVPAKPNPLLTVPEARANDPTTTVRARPARASDNEEKSHEVNPVLYGTQLDGNERSNEGHSTTPKSRPARAADHEGKPHDEINPQVAASHLGRVSGGHDDHEGHGTTPKSRPVRASGVPEKSGDSQEHPAQAVPLAKLGNTEQNPTPKSRPARATPVEETQASLADAKSHAHDGVKEAADKKKDETSNEHRHRRDTEGPQDISKTLTHVLVRGEPVPINLDEKTEDKIKENLPERKTRDTTEAKKDEGAAKVGTAQARPLLAAQARPAIQPVPAHHDRQRRDDAKAAARQPDAPSKASQPDSHSGHVVNHGKPENGARHVRDTEASTLPPFKGIHGPTQGDLENIRRAKEEREKQKATIGQ